MISFPLGHANCRRCWRPVWRCGCPPAALISDPAALDRLARMRRAAACGAWRGADDRGEPRAQRLAFARWLVERARIGVDDRAPAYPLLTPADFQADRDVTAALSGEGQSGG